jgi:hypothetical protein
MVVFIIISFERFLCEQPKPRLRMSLLASIGHPPERRHAKRVHTDARAKPKVGASRLLLRSCCRPSAFDFDFHAAKRARAGQVQQRGASQLREESYLECMLGTRRYLVLMNWNPGYWSAPHSYATDRLSLVRSGTWWVNSGDDFDPDNTVPVSAGGFVRRVAHTPH